jgi:hypothetical protein
VGIIAQTIGKNADLAEAFSVLFFAGMAAWFVWCYIAPLGFDLFVASMVLIVVVGIGWMRTYRD